MWDTRCPIVLCCTKNPKGNGGDGWSKARITYVLPYKPFLYEQASETIGIGQSTKESV
jgi:hypothetical protein